MTESKPSKEELLQAKITSLKTKFVLKSPDRIEELNSALDKSDWTTLKEIGHKLKGTSACLDLNDFSEIGKSIQVAAAEKDPEKIKKLIQEIDSCSILWLKNNPTS